VPAYCGCGIAGALMRAAEGATRSSGATTLQLCSNAARGLYRRLGWQDAFRAQVKGITMDVMRRDLTVAGGQSVG
jgi:predicted N-acetyltransferase YhbS